MPYEYTVYDVYYPNDWYVLSTFDTLEEALEYKAKLDKKENYLKNYVVVISN